MNGRHSTLLNAPLTARAEPEAPVTHAPHPAWGAPQVIAAIGLGAAILWCFWEPLRHLTQRWRIEPDYSHGFLIPVISAWLLWQRRPLIDVRASRGASIVALVLLLVGGVSFCFAAYFGYTLMSPAALIPVLLGTVCLVGGWPLVRAAGPAVLYLAFMIPLPGALAGLMQRYLQSGATIASTYLIQTFGIPATRAGNVIHLPGGPIGVVEACSGLRMLMAFFAITVAAAILVRRPFWERCLIALSAVPIGIAVNVMRISATAIVHERVGPELADRVFHDFAGWLMPLVAIGLLAAEMHFLSKLLIPAERRAAMPDLMVKRPGVESS